MTAPASVTTIFTHEQQCTKPKPLPQLCITPESPWLHNLLARTARTAPTFTNAKPPHLLLREPTAATTKLRCCLLRSSRGPHHNSTTRTPSNDLLHAITHGPADGRATLHLLSESRCKAAKHGFVRWKSTKQAAEGDYGVRNVTGEVTLGFTLGEGELR
ncbi:hypothetical protein DEO72_LG11g1862 [Vigna unguiculata]|uniref:Uncharacterized protein n=1 Tax=Vigna unguiculata TaxID=3917 RepID=A0A4D6NMJ2_VIGUN|nr:hypothetical protein DEO72_LG11g1862 [Vigna unguiculata]